MELSGLLEEVSIWVCRVEGRCERCHQRYKIMLIDRHSGIDDILAQIEALPGIGVTNAIETQRLESETADRLGSPY